MVRIHGYVGWFGVDIVGECVGLPGDVAMARGGGAQGGRTYGYPFDGNARV